MAFIGLGAVIAYKFAAAPQTKYRLIILWFMELVTVGVTKIKPSFARFSYVFDN